MTSLPDLPTGLVVSQVAAHIIAPPRGWFPAIPARNLHTCRADVALGVFPAFERSVTAGTDVSAALLLDRHSSGAWCFDQDACCGGTGGRRKGGRGVERAVVGMGLRRGGMILGLGSVWKGAGTTRVGISFEGVRAEEVTRRDAPLTAAVVGDQVRAHGEFIRAGWNWDRFVDRCDDSVKA
jgi:hypothetical protein